VWLTGTAVVLMALFVPIQFRDAQVGAAWAIEGLAVLVFVVRFGHEQRLAPVGAGLLGIGTLALFGALADAYPPDRLIATQATFFAAVVVACLVAASIVHRRIGWSTENAIPGYIWLLGAHAVGLVWMSQELTAEISRSLVAPGQAVQFSLTALWAIYGAALLSAGFALKTRWARMAGVALLAATVGKLALSDLWLLRTSYRIIAFVGLGAILLACSVLYQRFRDLVIGDDDLEPAPVTPQPPPVPVAAAPARKTAPATKKAPARKASKPRSKP
jgi:hypothetical protein